MSTEPFWIIANRQKDQIRNRIREIIQADWTDPKEIVNQIKLEFHVERWDMHLNLSIPKMVYWELRHKPQSEPSLVNEKCNRCFYFKQAFPFDFEKGQCSFEWDYCSQSSRYLKHGYMLSPIKPLDTSKQQIKLFPIDMKDIVQSWRGYFQWRPFLAKDCEKYLSFEDGVRLLLS